MIIAEDSLSSIGMQDEDTYAVFIDEQVITVVFNILEMPVVLC